MLPQRARPAGLLPRDRGRRAGLVGWLSGGRDDPAERL